MIRVITTARVQVTLEVELSSSWGEECALSQVWQQAKDSVCTQIHAKLGATYKIVGEPEVNAVIVPRT